MKRYVKSLPHDEAMAWVDQLCDELGDQKHQSSVLGWDELRRLASEGVTLAAHTRTHPLMNRISLSEARAEAVGSYDDLRREIGDVPKVFSYPSGGFTEDVSKMLADEGFLFAFTTCRNLNDVSKADPYLLRRINVGRRTTPAIFRAQLLSWSRCLKSFAPLVSP